MYYFSNAPGAEMSKKVLIQLRYSVGLNFQESFALKKINISYKFKLRIVVALNAFILHILVWLDHSSLKAFKTPWTI